MKTPPPHASLPAWGFCLAAMLLAALWSTIPPANTVGGGMADHAPCYGLTSETADAACVLTTRTGQETVPVFLRTPFVLPRTPGTGRRVSLPPAGGIPGGSAPSNNPPVTAHHLRV